MCSNFRIDELKKDYCFKGYNKYTLNHDLKFYTQLIKDISRQNFSWFLNINFNFQCPTFTPEIIK